MNKNQSIEIIKFCDLNNENELIDKFEKLNLKRQDVYLVKSNGKCYVCFKQKNDFKNRIKKFISKMKIELEKWFKKQNEINLLTG